MWEDEKMILITGGRAQGKRAFWEKNIASGERLFKACPGRVLVTDEIGLGIVPLDPFEREYREETGRICCLLAARSEQVWRVACGLGQRLK